MPGRSWWNDPKPAPQRNRGAYHQSTISVGAEKPKHSPGEFLGIPDHPHEQECAQYLIDLWWDRVITETEKAVQRGGGGLVKRRNLLMRLETGLQMFWKSSARLRHSTLMNIMAGSYALIPVDSEKTELRRLRSAASKRRQRAEQKAQKLAVATASAEAVKAD